MPASILAEQQLEPGPPHALEAGHLAGAGAVRPLVMVLGMHRSGTSLCANVLAGLGVDMAEAAAPSPHNARGHWERHRINDLHDEIFAMHRGRWNEAAHHLALPDQWWTTPAAQAIGERVAAYLAPIMDQADIAGFKDPRTARLLPLWDAILGRLHAEPRFVFCLRNPVQVARSIEARDGSERAQAEYRWLIYNAHALSGIGTRPVCIVRYEDWFAAPAATARRLAHWVRPGFAIDDAQVTDLVSGIVDAGLRHDSSDAASCGNAAALRMSAMVRACVSSHQLSPPLLALAQQFLDFEQAVTPLLRDAVILRSSVADQNRVINELQAAIRQLRQG